MICLTRSRNGPLWGFSSAKWWILRKRFYSFRLSSDPPGIWIHSTINNSSIVAPSYIRSIIWQTYDKRPRIPFGFGSTDDANVWVFTLRWWIRSNTTGNFLLPGISGSCCSIFDVIWDAAGRLVERVRPERKVWLLLVIQTSVRINCIRHRDQCWRISRISIRQGAGSHIVNCMELVDGQKMLYKNYSIVINKRSGWNLRWRRHRSFDKCGRWLMVGKWKTGEDERQQRRKRLIAGIGPLSFIYSIQSESFVNYITAISHKNLD